MANIDGWNWCFSPSFVKGMIGLRNLHIQLNEDLRNDANFKKAQNDGPLIAQRVLNFRLANLDDATVVITDNRFEIDDTSSSVFSDDSEQSVDGDGIPRIDRGRQTKYRWMLAKRQELAEDIRAVLLRKVDPKLPAWIKDRTKDVLDEVAPTILPGVDASELNFLYELQEEET